MGDECWNSVSVYGPTVQIERFRRMCIELPPDSDPRNVRGGWGGCAAEIGYKWIVPATRERPYQEGTIIYATNYREHAPEPGSWFFAFDTRNWFPDDLFEELALLFPALHFDCDCIDSMDEFMGCGWFNPPPGGEAFRQDMNVPQDYWTGGGAFKRTPEAQAKHDALVETLIRAAQ